MAQALNKQWKRQLHYVELILNDIMMLLMNKILLFFLIILTGCGKAEITDFSDTACETIVFIPYDGVTNEEIASYKDSFKKLLDSNFPDNKYQFIIEAPQILPSTCLNDFKTRLRADRVVDYMPLKPHYIFIGVTKSDISLPLHGSKDYGILGLAPHRGKCIVSTYRIRNKQLTYKIIMHEFLHTRGLRHCPNENCIMQDAKGHIKFDKMKVICDSCKEHYKRKKSKLE